MIGQDERWVLVGLSMRAFCRLRTRRFIGFGLVTLADEGREGRRAGGVGAVSEYRECELQPPSGRTAATECSEAFCDTPALGRQTDAHPRGKYVFHRMTPMHSDLNGLHRKFNFESVSESNAGDGLVWCKLGREAGRQGGRQAGKQGGRQGGTEAGRQLVPGAAVAANESRDDVRVAK